MLKAQQLVSSLVNEGPDKGKIKYASVLDAYFFQFPADQPTVEFTSKIGKDSTPYPYQIPDESKEVSTDQETLDSLMAEAIQKASEVYPKENSILAILAAFSDRVNLTIKNQAKATLEPKDVDAEVEKLRKFYTKRGLSADKIEKRLAEFREDMAT